MDEKTIEAAETILAKGYCVELRPVKDGVKVIQVIRQQITEKVIRQQITEKTNKAPSP